MRRTLRTALVVYAVATAVYAIVSWDRLWTPSPDNHFSYLADSFLHGQLHLRTDPPHHNDWARYQGRWYVSFPPFPALLVIPGVAAFGLSFLDRLFAVLLAGLGPAATFLVLRKLAERGDSSRTEREDLFLAGVFAFGTVYFFSAVQGSVWFVAHVVALPLLAVYVLASLDVRRPVLAGAALGCAFLTRTPLLFAFPFFLFEVARAPKASRLRALAFFVLPLAVIGAFTAWFNYARFGNPFVFGHEYLQVRWADRIERWGLFNYHYLAKNLSAALTLVPWLSRVPPYVRISGHGLSLLVTTPVFAYLLWPRTRGRLHLSLWITAAAVALPSLLYQNTGWLQFGYRFSLDYTLFLVMLLAIGARPFTRTFHALCVVAVAVNLFGAVTFNRMPAFYDADRSAKNVFQPDS